MFERLYCFAWGNKTASGTLIPGAVSFGAWTSVGASRHAATDAAREQPGRVTEPSKQLFQKR
jgi:hypothetical protein